MELGALRLSQPAVLYFHTSLAPATNQPAVFFSHNKQYFSLTINQPQPPATGEPNDAFQRERAPVSR
jgi:hypothetical protein